MKKILLVLGLLLLFPQLVLAQTKTSVCFTTNGINCVDVSASNPFPVTGSGGGAVTQGTTPWVIDTVASGGVGNLINAVTSGVITPGSAVPGSAIYLGGNVGGTGRGWTFVNPTGTVYAAQTDVASVGGITVSTYGSNPGAVPAAPVNANVTNTVTVTSTPSYGAAQLSHQVLSFSSTTNIAITRSIGTIKVYQLELSCASNLTTITPSDGTSTSLGAKSATQYIYEGLQTEPIYTTTGTNNFNINLSAGVTCTGFAKYKDS